MCIIIDTNVLANVFDNKSANHSDFKPVKDWIIDGKGKIVFGGTKYLKEIKGKYLIFFLELKKAKKAVLINADLVDAEQHQIEKMIVNSDFDDPHLISLLRVSGCKLICSLDKRAYPFIRSKIFFSPSKKRPRIYSRLANLNLLSDPNIAEICKPCLATNFKTNK